MSIKGAQVDRPELSAGRARKCQPREPGRDGSTDCRVEPQGSPTSLTRIPDRDDLLRFGNRLALGFGTLRSFRGKGGGALSIQCAAVRSHERRLAATRIGARGG